MALTALFLWFRFKLVSLKTVQHLTITIQFTFTHKDNYKKLYLRILENKMLYRLLRSYFEVFAREIQIPNPQSSGLRTFALWKAKII